MTISIAWKAGTALAAAALLAAGPYANSLAQPGRSAKVTDQTINWSSAGRDAATASPHHGGAGPSGSTHEIAFDERAGGDLVISGQNWDALVRVATADGAMRFHPLPKGSGPHGIEYDKAGRLWVTLEYHGRVIALDRDGKVAARHDVRLDCSTCPEKINSHPHGLGIAPDGETVWFTGKATGTIGRIAPDGKVTTLALPTAGSTPIYIRAGPDGNMWVTELTGNKIARVTQKGEVTEFAIPTPGSRPIAIVPGPDGAMWFSEEAGNKVARIDRDGNILEYAVPKSQANVILAGLAFDRDGNLWVQQYVDQNNPSPPGRDHVVRIDKAILAAAREGRTALPRRAFAFFAVPTKATVMHRIIQGPDGNMWFTEMKADKVGKVRLLPVR